MANRDGIPTRPPLMPQVAPLAVGVVVPDAVPHPPTLTGDDLKRIHREGQEWHEAFTAQTAGMERVTGHGACERRAAHVDALLVAETARANRMERDLAIALRDLDAVMQSRPLTITLQTVEADRDRLRLLAAAVVAAWRASPDGSAGVLSPMMALSDALGKEPK